MTSCATTTCGVGGWGGPLPGDPDNNSILTATPAFGGIDVSWTYPASNPEAVAYVQLYRGLSSIFANAILLATVGGNFFYDKSTSSQLIEYFYWIKIVSVNGTVGALIGPASAIAKPPIADVIEGLTGRIDSGLLAQDLKSEIDKITLNYTDLLNEVDSRIAANTALSAALAQVQSGVVQTLAFINEEITQRQEGDSSVVTQVNTIAAANANNLALIQQEQVARVDGDSANAALYTTLNSQVNNPTTGLPATRATLTNDYYTKADTNSAISSATLNLVSQTGLNTALSSYTTTASLQTNYFTKTQTNSAISSSATSLQATINTNHTTAMNAAAAAQTSANTANTLLSDISSDSLLTPGEKPVVVKEYNTLIAEQAGIQAQASSYGITTELTAYNNAVSALTTYLNGRTGWDVIPGSNVTIDGTTFRTNFQNVYTTRQALLNAIHARAKELADNAQGTANTVSANLTNNYLTSVETNSAISSAITTSQTTLNDNIASAQTTLQTNIDTVDGEVTQIGARYTAVVSVNGLIGGFGVYNDGSTIQAGFDVDEFWVGKTQSNKRKPFIISGGVTYIDEAAIEKLTFTKLRDTSGSFIVENGKVKADYLTVTNSITVPSVGGNIELGNDVGPGTGHYGLSLSHVDFNNIFLRRSDGVVFFRINDGGTNSLTFDSSSGILSISGTVQAESLSAQSMNVALRDVLETGSLTVPLKSIPGAFTDDNGSTQQYPAGTVFRTEINMLIATNTYDNYLVSTFRQQPFRATVTPTGVGTYSGGNGNFNISIDSEVMVSRRYSPGGVSSLNDTRVYIYVRGFIVTNDSIFNYFMLPTTLNWTLSRA
jgi:hypothetical protein